MALSNSFERIASKVTPAVVNIDTESVIRLSEGGPDGPSALFNRFFRMGGVPREPEQESLGSGVILDPDGYILTNYHVIIQDDNNKPVDSIRVHLQGNDNGGRGYAGKIVGFDKWTDLAVVKIDAGRKLPTAVLGDSDDARVGDWVLAIGSPFGLNATVTAGIISAKGREINHSAEDEFKRFLQTDAVINPGNSGGPLVSMAGQVIGINTEIATSRGVYDGVGFAIPSKIVRKVYNSIVTTGAVRRGAIGVSVSGLQSPALLRAFGADHGVVVEGVEANGPAARAGIRRGDVITAINSNPINDGNELVSVISNTEAGRRIRIDFLRNGKQKSCDLTVADWDKIIGAESAAARVPPREIPPANSMPEGLGLTVRGINPDEAKALADELRLSAPTGVKVESVEPGSFADGLGLQAFDVILRIDHKAVSSVADFKRIQSQLRPGQDVLFLVARRTGAGYSTFYFADSLP
ncbi:MAG: trypsin-like peptidase domain-containing protein [Acidobacteriota bacterium]|nr:trypsin-like peptidase domain-containing protein [Acidobacteriota bacterium]